MNVTNVAAKRIHQRDVSRGFSYWHDMMRRTSGSNRTKSAAYEAVYVCDEWKDFERFAEWFVQQPRLEGWVLDKDLLSPCHAKVYSPGTCCFLPRELNQMLVSSRKDSNGMPGVCFSKGKYAARVKVRNRRLHIGTFSTAEDALCAYFAAKTGFLSIEADAYKGDLHPDAYAALKGYNFRAALDKSTEGASHE
ncbi:hypothetical protein [Pseudomonas protegens]|uniref:hypothetical protein n=1 Tax=Pseudomonas protegens TaxID=380021 RepID=UPI0027651096|nr:hypothetical protein [Pseudomonas protegens]MDP9528552.1 hypothetical protein [Pseudomonas protegens]